VVVVVGRTNNTIVAATPATSFRLSKDVPLVNVTLNCGTRSQFYHHKQATEDRHSHWSHAVPPSKFKPLHGGQANTLTYDRSTLVGVDDVVGVDIVVFDDLLLAPPL
jgi:hypothetical protein